MQYTNRQILFDNEQNEEQIIRSKNLSLLLKKLSILCLTCFYFGYCLVYITALSDATISDVFGTQFNIPWVKGLLVGCLTLGAMIGSIIAIPLVPRVSRRTLTLCICICTIILQCVIQAPYAAALFTGRSFQGVCTGIFLQLMPAYISELAPTQIAKKRIFGVMTNAFVIIGVLTSFSLNIILIVAELEQSIRWRVIFAINFIAICIVTISIIIGYIPESPNSLIELKQTEKAKQVIGMFHKKRYIEEVYLERQRQVLQRKLPKQQIKSPSMIRKILAYELPMMQQLTGINAFVSQMGGVASAYQVYFGLFVPSIMATVHVIGALYSMTCLTRAKRKTMILTGNYLMGLCSLGIGIVFLYINQFRAGFWIVVALTFTYMTIHGATLIPGVWTYVGQIVNDNTPKYSSITNWFMCSVTIIVFPIINAHYGFAPIFITFGVLSLVLAIFNSIFMFETNERAKNLKSFELQ